MAGTITDIPRPAGNRYVSRFVSGCAVSLPRSLLERLIVSSNSATHVVAKNLRFDNRTAAAGDVVDSFTPWKYSPLPSPPRGQRPNSGGRILPSQIVPPSARPGPKPKENRLKTPENRMPFPLQCAVLPEKISTAPRRRPQRYPARAAGCRPTRWVQSMKLPRRKNYAQMFHKEGTGEGRALDKKFSVFRVPRFLGLYADRYSSNWCSGKKWQTSGLWRK